MDFLHREILLGFTVREVVIAAIVIMILWSGVKKLLTGKPRGATLVKKKCRGCTWTGPAGQETKRCPKCRGPLIATE